MKKQIVLLLIICITYSCNNDSKKHEDSKIDIEVNSPTNSAPNTSREDIDNIEESELDIELKNLFNLGEGFLENSDVNDTNIQLNSNRLLDMLEKSGVSRSEMEKLINNPDSLKALVLKMKNEEMNVFYEQNNETIENTYSNSDAQSHNENNTSIYDAIKMVQDESGVDAMMDKLRKGDSLAGTNTMSQIPSSSSSMTDNERKLIDHIKRTASNFHTIEEVNTLMGQIEEIEKKLVSNTDASEQFKAALKYRKSNIKFYKADLERKATVAKNKFKKLNPDLFYGDNVGVSYVGNLKKTVYLPLGALSFADEVIAVNHPKLMTSEVGNVLGQPDVVETFDDATGIYSLGLGGDLTIKFIDNALVDVNGPDLYLFEIGQLEPTELEISKDGNSWIKIGKIDGGVAEVDIEPYVKPNELYYYVRFTDLKEKSGIPGADVDAVAAIGSAMRLKLDSQVLFDSGKSTLKPEGVKAVKALVEQISVLKKGKIIIEGHTDDVGSDTKNITLSLARAQSVSKVLREYIPSSNFKWVEKGRGETQPLVKNDSDFNRAKNRRVEILVVPN